MLLASRLPGLFVKAEGTVMTSEPSLTFEVQQTPHPVSSEERSRVLENPGFGKLFTDHMITIRWSQERGWHDARMVPYASLELDPATTVLHYAQTIFEGFKAYHQHRGGGVKTFRPDANARRLNRSAARMALPSLPEDAFVEAADLLIRTDRAWVPTEVDQSLYVRPFMFATEVGLGVRPASEVLFMVLASPSAAYFPRGIKPVSVWLSGDYVRAAPGGTGDAKTGGNYAGGLVGQRQAWAQGCDEVVWLDAAERRYVEEMGGMNLFFVYGTPGDPDGDVTLVSPELTGTLLPGITRESLHVLGRELGYKVEERRVSVEEWRRDAAEGRLTEVFACGTAAVITPVGEVKSARDGFTIADGQPGPVTTRLRQSLLDIQHGLAPDTQGWMHTVC